MTTPTQADLLGEVIAVLCAAEAYWSGTCCILNLEAGLTQPVLQTALEVSYPDSGWDTNPNQLTTILTYGRKQGALWCYNNPESGISTYFARIDMARVNVSNEQYREVCPAILEQPTKPNIRPVFT